MSGSNAAAIRRRVTAPQQAANIKPPPAPVKQPVKNVSNGLTIQNFISEKKFDIIYFDAFSPEKQTEMWTTEVFEKCFDLLNKDGFLVTYCAKGIFRRTLNCVGFEVISLNGPPGKRQMTRANKSTCQK